MSRLLKFDYDNSIWRYQETLDPKWLSVPYKTVSGDRWKIRITKRGDYIYHEHQYTILNFNGVKLDIDAVLGKREGPMRITATTICHIGSETVGITRRTGGVYGGGNSGFTYIAIAEILVGISPPLRGRESWFFKPPIIEVWTLTSTVEEGREPGDSEIELTKIPAKDGFSRRQIRNRSSLGRYAHDGRTIVADGTGLAGPMYGNPRELRRIELGEPD